MLTDLKARTAKPADKPLKLADGGGLYLLLTPAGGKLWRMKYRHQGKERVLSFGPYPGVGLADARKARDAAKATLREGRDPSVVRQAAKAAAAVSAANTFEALAREWHALNLRTWTTKHAEDVLGSLERDVFPKLGRLPIVEITPLLVLDVVRAIEKRPAIETARRVRQRMSATFVYAIATGRAETDPAAIVRGALAPLVKGRQPAVTSLDDAREVLRRADETPAHPVTKLALRFLALTVVRPGTLITTPWSELDAALADADNPVWRIPAERMKLRLQHKDDEARDHLVPLSRQAVEVIEALRQFSGRGPLAFPNSRHAHKPMSENAIGYLLNRAGYHHRHVPHGWRATFSTIMNERRPADHRVIDLMLAHVPKDKVEGAYNRAAHLERRREIAQEWADLIMEGSYQIDELLHLPCRTMR